MSAREEAARFDFPPDSARARELLMRIARERPAVAPGKIAKPLYLYGAGSLGRMAFAYFRDLGVQVAGVIDRNAAALRADLFWAGVKLMTPDEAPATAKREGLLALCVVTSPWAETVAPLRAAGWADIAPFYMLCAGYLDRHPLDNGWLSGPLDAEDIAGMEQALAGYEDDISRAHHLMFAAWHILGQEWVFGGAPVDTGNRYFIPEVKALLGARETFADLGAHHGHVSARFIKETGGQFAGIVAVEPDPVNLESLRAWAAGLPEVMRRRIRVEDCVLGEKEGRARFWPGLDYVSRIVGQGGAEKEVTMLDRLGIAPTVIKAHLEGGECDALLGAAETIKRHRPVIALTVYHDRAGLWRIQARLRAAFGGLGYRFLFRLHGWQGTGAVLYMLPPAH